MFLVEFTVKKGHMRVRDCEGIAGLFHLVLHNRKTGCTMICARTDQGAIGSDFSIPKPDSIFVKLGRTEIVKLRIDDQ